MRPTLKISNLISLQDARSSAAVGFDMISFNLERGNAKKLSASMIWNMVNWLSGPEFILEMNVASLDELQEIKQLFQWQRITIPVAEWDERIFLHSEQVILKADELVDPTDIAAWASSAKDNQDLKVEIAVSDLDAAARYESVKEHILLHFPSFESVTAFIQAENYVPFGFAFGEEAEEEPGFLHYEKIDDFMELFQERFQVE